MAQSNNPDDWPSIEELSKDVVRFLKEEHTTHYIKMKCPHGKDVFEVCDVPGCIRNPRTFWDHTYYD